MRSKYSGSLVLLKFLFWFVYQRLWFFIGLQVLFFPIAAEQVQRCTYQNNSHSQFASFLFSLRCANASWPALAINFASGTLNPERQTHPREYVDTVASGRSARTSKQVYCKKHCKIISPRIITELTQNKPLKETTYDTPLDISCSADNSGTNVNANQRLPNGCKQTVAKLLVCHKTRILEFDEVNTGLN